MRRSAGATTAARSTRRGQETPQQRYYREYAGGEEGARYRSTAGFEDIGAFSDLFGDLFGERGGMRGGAGGGGASRCAGRTRNIASTSISSMR